MRKFNGIVSGTLYLTQVHGNKLTDTGTSQKNGLDDSTVETTEVPSHGIGLLIPEEFPGRLPKNGKITHAAIHP